MEAAFNICVCCGKVEYWSIPEMLVTGLCPKCFDFMIDEVLRDIGSGKQNTISNPANGGVVNAKLASVTGRQ